MPEVTSDKHYESKYESSLLKAIRQRAEEKDISYTQAAYEVFPEYNKDLSFRNTEVEDAQIAKRMKEMAAIRERMAKEGLMGGK